VRQELARYVTGVCPPQAWVVRPMIIRKAGAHSVGVERSFLADLGQVVNAQRATGVWAASATMSAPVNWRLHLPSAWLDDRSRRARAAIPDEAEAKTPGDCSIETYLSMSSAWGLPALPVVVDAREADVPSLFGKVNQVLARISGPLQLAVRDRTLTGRTDERLPAHEIITMCRDRRRPVSVTGCGGLAATTRVAIPGGDRELLLVGEWETGRGWPTRLWLTDMIDRQPSDLVRLGRLEHRVARDFTSVADRVGIRDYAGRSYDGWHRHTTLASVAHTIAVLAGVSRADAIGAAS
jgi:hypothetical protein